MHIGDVKFGDDVTLYPCATRKAKASARMLTSNSGQQTIT